MSQTDFFVLARTTLWNIKTPKLSRHHGMRDSKIINILFLPSQWNGWWRKWNSSQRSLLVRRYQSLYVSTWWGSSFVSSSKIPVELLTLEALERRPFSHSVNSFRDQNISKHQGSQGSQEIPWNVIRLHAYSGNLAESCWHPGAPCRVGGSSQRSSLNLKTCIESWLVGSPDQRFHCDVIFYGWYLGPWWVAGNFAL